MFTVRVVLVDDGSTDGTSAAVAQSFPGVHIVYSGDNLFWAKGMCLAEKTAKAMSEPTDFFLWLNDDVTLQTGALAAMLDSAYAWPGSVIVGSTTEKSGDKITYSGMVKTGPSPTQLRRLPPNGQCQRVDTFNGNVVLMPSTVFYNSAGVDPGYDHAYGDTDFGLRLSREGVSILLAPDPVGICDRPATLAWLDPRRGLVARVSSLLSKKGLPVGSHWRYIRKNSPTVKAPVFFVISYGKSILKLISVRSVDLALRDHLR